MSNLSAHNPAFFAPLATALALALLPAGPTAAKSAPKGSCDARQSAVLEGRETLGMLGITHTVIQNLTMVKKSGKGLVGPWTGTEWDYTQILPPVQDPSVAAAVMKAINAMPATKIPGLSATCRNEMLSPSELHVHCTGKYPFELHENGTITTQGGHRKLGHFTKATVETPAKITLSTVPVNPMFHGTVSGDVRERGNIGLNPKISASYNYLSAESATFLVRVTVKPYDAGAAQALRASAIYSGNRPADVHIQTGRDGPEATVRIKFDGSPMIRGKMEAATVIKAHTIYQGCPASNQWPLTAFILFNNLQQ